MDFDPKTHFPTKEGFGETVLSIPELQAEIARLTAEVDSTYAAWSREVKRGDEWKDRAEKAEAERDALAAAAFEAAAKYVQSHEQSGVNCNWRGMADTIRDFTPADAKAALDRMLREAKAEGMREAAETRANIDGIGPSLMPRRWFDAILSRAKDMEAGNG